MNKTINIFIPAAGFGERLRPITFHFPKPLLPILSQPVLQKVLERALNLPVDKLGINLHHMKEAIEEWVVKSPFSKKITLFHEDTILGTGGALKNAEGFLGNSTFLVHNSDILSDINLQELLERHLSSENLVTLAVHDYPEFNNVVLDENGFLAGIGTGFKPVPENGAIAAFTGIAVYEPEFLKFLPVGASSVVDAWLKAVASGCRVGTFNVNGCYWSDIGTPDRYARAVIDALRSDGETMYIHTSTRGCTNIELNGYAVVEEGYVFGGPVSLKNCILLPAGLSQGPSQGMASALENCIIGPGFEIHLNESEITAVSREDDRHLIGAGGSDRNYYRIKRGNRSAVLMECMHNDPDFERHIEYTKFFLKQSIPVPELFEVDPDERKAVFEDAGNTSLYNWLKCFRNEEEIEKLYRRVIDTLASIHTFATDHVDICPVLKKRIFDYEYFRWETDYFIERFIEDIRGIQTRDLPEIEDELNSLAFKADSFPKTIIHRDFQSQNIMVRSDGTLIIIDYQGARMGPSAYDVASILWDPYYRLKNDMRERLVDFYISKIEDKFDADYFRETLLVCRLQRHMQALGAYGFLSSVKGKKYFLKYVPEGLRLLKEDISLLKDEYPELHKLVARL